MCLSGRMLLETRLGALETSGRVSKIPREMAHKREAGFCCFVPFAGSDLPAWCRCSIILPDHRLDLMPDRYILFTNGVLLDQWPTLYHEALIFLFLVQW